MTASFVPDGAGNLVATGGATGDDIGTSSLGAGYGTVAAQSVPPGQAPTMPEPPVEDGGGSVSGDDGGL